MTRSVLCPLAVLLAAGWSAGQPPKDDPPGKKDPAPPPNRFPGAARAAQEEVEVLEAQLATKEAYVKAAEVAADGPRVRLARVVNLAKAGTVTQDEVEAAKVEVRLAEAQVAIRRAEANEVAVKLKHARGRVERGGRPAGGRAAGPVPDPREAWARLTEAEVAAQFARREAEAARRADPKGGKAVRRAEEKATAAERKANEAAVVVVFRLWAAGVPPTGGAGK